MWQTFHDAWWRLATQSQPASFLDTFACGALRVCSTAYQCAVALRNGAYDSGWARQRQLPCRVISVGNITVGGTGKTACVELIVRRLQAMGRRVAVLSRGYGGSRRLYWLRWQDGTLFINGQADASIQDLADEPRLLARHLDGVPVVVAADRVQAGQFACRSFGVDTVVLDDGFQHRRLRRDCDIVLIHALMPLGGWMLFPRGPMREPLDSLRRAQVMIVTKADEALEKLGALKERLHAMSPEATILSSVHEPSHLVDGLTQRPLDLKQLARVRVGLLSSIGDPHGFESTVQRLGASIDWHAQFPDHHCYTQKDWLSIRLRTEQRCQTLLTTEKDWVRLASFAVAEPPAVPLWVLGIRMTMLSGERALDDRLARLYAG